jgi:folate-binding protein YgfZ
MSTNVIQAWHVEHGGTGEAWAPTGCAVANYGMALLEVEAGRRAALVVDRSQCARIQLTGADRRDLLNRLTTNDVLDIPEGQGRPTVFTTGKGRVVDRVVVHAAADGDLIIGNAGRSEALQNWIQQYVIREDVQMADLTSSTAMLDLLGPRAGEALGAPLLGYAEMHEMAVVDVNGIQVLATRSDPVAGQTLRLVVPRELAPQLLDALVRRGAKPGGGEAYNVLRLEAGLPLFGPELNDQHSPLEAGLIDALHFNKGCYVGQEVVARIDTYMKQRRYLVAVELDGPPPPPGTRLSLPNGDEGEVTSSAAMGQGKSRMLGYLKTQDPVVGMEVRVGDPAEQHVATLVHRPAQQKAPKGGEGSQCAVVI